MTKPRLVATSHFTDAVEERMNTQYDVLRCVGGSALHQELIALTKDADAMFVTPLDRLDAMFFEAISPTVKVIANYSVGVDHIDLKAAAARGIPIAFTPGVNADATADIAMLLMLGASRRAFEAQEMLRSGGWSSTHTLYLGSQMTGKTLGIVGMGQVGQAVARRARAFGMEVHYTNPRKLAGDVAGDAVFHEHLADLLAVSQFLSLNAPETKDTHHLLNKETLALLPAGAVVVNTGRGGLVDDQALIAALRSGHVAAAGLDVFEGEPSINPDYLLLANTFLTPHLGSATVETRTHMGMLCLDNIEAVLGGRPAPNLVKF